MNINEELYIRLLMLGHCMHALERHFELRYKTKAKEHDHDLPLRADTGPRWIDDKYSHRTENAQLQSGYKLGQ